LGTKPVFFGNETEIRVLPGGESIVSDTVAKGEVIKKKLRREKAKEGWLSVSRRGYLQHCTGVQRRFVCWALQVFTKKSKNVSVLDIVEF
jgi:hypothetical protein